MTAFLNSSLVDCKKEQSFQFWLLGQLNFLRSNTPFFFLLLRFNFLKDTGFRHAPVVIFIPINRFYVHFMQIQIYCLTDQVLCWLFNDTCLGYTGHAVAQLVNPLTPNDPYRGRTAPITSTRCILYNYSTNIGTEYFKHGIYTLLFIFSSKCSLFHNSNVFGSCIIHILYTGCAKIKNKSGVTILIGVEPHR